MFKSKDLLYHSIAILTVIIWGTTFVSTKILINTGLSPVEILLYRFVLAYFCILTIAHRRLWAKLRKKMNSYCSCLDYVVVPYTS